MNLVISDGQDGVWNGRTVYSAVLEPGTTTVDVDIGSNGEHKGHIGNVEFPLPDKFVAFKFIVADPDNRDKRVSLEAGKLCKGNFVSSVVRSKLADVYLWSDMYIPENDDDDDDDDAAAIEAQLCTPRSDPTSTTIGSGRKRRDRRRLNDQS